MDHPNKGRWQWLPYVQEQMGRQSEGGPPLPCYALEKEKASSVPKACRKELDNICKTKMAPIRFDEGLRLISHVTALRTSG